MSNDEKDKLFYLRCKTKQGQTISEEEQKFCSDMFNMYPKEYSDMSRDVFEATRPFG